VSALALAGEGPGAPSDPRRASAAAPRAFGASVQGRSHARLGRNNQDGWALAVDPARTAAVVTDGCGSQPRSEVGALLGAHFLARWLVREPISSELPERAALALQGFLATVAGGLGGGAALLEAQFLFTFLALVREGPRVSVFGLGDGAALVDGTWLQLDPGPENAPPYLAYRLGSPMAHHPRVQQHFLGEAAVAAVMTDGLEALARSQLEALVEGVADWRNPLTLQRRLNVLHAAAPFLDDATLVVAGGR